MHFDATRPNTIRKLIVKDGKKKNDLHEKEQQQVLVLFFLLTLNVTKLDKRGECSRNICVYQTRSLETFLTLKEM